VLPLRWEKGRTNAKFYDLRRIRFYQEKVDAMRKTRNSLPEEQRAKLVELLNRRLADGIDLLLQTKQAYWNVNGPQFLALHALFGQIAHGVEVYVDLLAERVVQLGGSADGTAYVVMRRTSLDRYPLEIVDGNGHIDALAIVLASFGKHVRYAIGQATDLIDADSAALFTDISRDIDTWLWLVEAHLPSVQ
jgi:starvation-inducible DNA-binding protein